MKSVVGGSCKVWNIVELDCMGLEFDSGQNDGIQPHGNLNHGVKSLQKWILLWT
jgi:hypothetical protein